MKVNNVIRELNDLLNDDTRIIVRGKNRMIMGNWYTDDILMNDENVTSFKYSVKTDILIIRTGDK